MKPVRILYTLIGATALASAFCLSNCKVNNEIIPFVKEVCNDAQDNDSDGKIDCQDTDCDVECEVVVNINPIAEFSGTDTVQVFGNHSKATGIVLSVTPSGSPGAATIVGDTWSGRVTQLNTPNTTYTITAIASGALGRHDTDIVTVHRND